MFHIRRDAGALSYCQRAYRIRNETESRCVVTRPPLNRSAAVGAAITPPASGAATATSPLQAIMQSIACGFGPRGADHRHHQRFHAERVLPSTRHMPTPALYAHV